MLINAHSEYFNDLLADEPVHSLIPIKNDSWSNNPDTPTNTKAEDKKIGIIALKAFAAIALIGALAIATFFSGGATISMIITKTAAWKPILLGVLSYLSASSTLGAIYYAIKGKMYQDTNENLKDAKHFLKNTLTSPIKPFLKGTT